VGKVVRRVALALRALRLLKPFDVKLHDWTGIASGRIGLA